MKQLQDYLKDLQNEGIIHKDVNEHIMFLVKKLLSKK
jgi:DNA-binding HxlR family transcriptional regulator